MAITRSPLHPDPSHPPPWLQPSHPNLIKVHNIPQTSSSYATSLVSLPAGALFTPITNYVLIPHRTWPSVQSARPGMHIDLNSDLFFVNHGCVPSLEFDVEKMEVRVSRERDLKVGDLLTFFYPSTEWEMVQAFDCFCNEEGCLGQIVGASQMPRTSLQGYWVNRHVRERLDWDGKGDAAYVDVKELEHP
ncbi:MAG: hypothetical protein Q9167_002493 [Letrouitia subvulpina]